MLKVFHIIVAEPEMSATGKPDAVYYTRVYQSVRKNSVALAAEGANYAYVRLVSRIKQE
jgi:hypothetical protein